jgi:hypothetical protein
MYRIINCGYPDGYNINHRKRLGPIFIMGVVRGAHFRIAYLIIDASNRDCYANKFFDLQFGKREDSGRKGLD